MGTQMTRIGRISADQFRPIHAPIKRIVKRAGLKVIVFEPETKVVAKWQK